jgi:hypothetical protein
MGEGMPSELYSTGGLFELKGKITTPDTLTSEMAFGKAKVSWQHRLWGAGDATKEFNNGIFFYGDKATMFADDSGLALIHAGKDVKREDFSIPTEMMQEKHMETFLGAVRNRDKKLINCTPEDAFQSTATVQLAMISYYTGSVVKWDLQKKEIINNSPAGKLLKREYRSKYVHP